MNLAVVLAAVAAALAAPIPSSPALAQTQPFVAAPLGTRIVANAGRAYEIDSVDGNVVRTVSSNYTTLVWLGMCFPLSEDREFNVRGADAIWPLAAGKTASFEFAFKERRWSVGLTVVGAEKVTVPAGTFDAWVIEADEKALTHNYRGVYRCSYAPEAGFLIKRTFELKEGTNNYTPVEAIKIERRDRSKVAEFRPPVAGTVFETSLGGYQIDGAEGTNLIRKSDRPNLNTTWVGGLIMYDSSDHVLGDRKQTLAKLWPLEVGKSTSFETTRPNGAVWTNSIKVERAEVIKVPAGTFATFVIKRQERTISGSYNVITTYWWSPALGFPIKREAHFIAGSSSPSNYELRKVSVPR